MVKTWEYCLPYFAFPLLPGRARRGPAPRARIPVRCAEGGTEAARRAGQGWRGQPGATRSTASAPPGSSHRHIQACSSSSPSLTPRPRGAPGPTHPAGGRGPRVMSPEPSRPALPRSRAARAHELPGSSPMPSLFDFPQTLPAPQLSCWTPLPSPETSQITTAPPPHTSWYFSLGQA